MRTASKKKVISHSRIAAGRKLINWQAHGLSYKTTSLRHVLYIEWVCTTSASAKLTQSLPLCSHTLDRPSLPLHIIPQIAHKRPQSINIFWLSFKVHILQCSQGSLSVYTASNNPYPPKPPSPTLRLHPP